MIKHWNCGSILRKLGGDSKMQFRRGKTPPGTRGAKITKRKYLYAVQASGSGADTAQYSSWIDCVSAMSGSLVSGPIWTMSLHTAKAGHSSW